MNFDLYMYLAFPFESLTSLLTTRYRSKRKMWRSFCFRRICFDSTT